MLTSTAPQLDESFAGYIRRIRQQLSMSQKALADKAGIHLHSLGKIEREQTTRLNQKTLRGLAYALEIPAAYLEAVTKGIPLSVTTSVKFCPICWIPGTAPDSMWTDARAKFCFACGTALRHQCLSCSRPVVSLKFRFCPYCGNSYKMSST